MLIVAASVTRMLVSESRGWWLRNRLFLVAEAPFLSCGSVSNFGCGIAEIWLRKRRNMVSESEFMHAIRMIKFSRFQDTLYSLPQISL